MTIALIFAFGMNLITYWFSDKIVLKMYCARQVSEAEAPELFGIVRRRAQKAEIPMYLANALKKLHMIAQKVPMNANPAFIVSPLSGGGILNLYCIS